MENNKKNGFIFGIIIILLINTVSISQLEATTTDGVEWDAAINFEESGGGSDYVVFGEADDANDGPPHDDYDMPKPPSPPAPYIRSWFNDGLSPPYTQLLKDYRHYPDIQKIWNLSIQWIPDDGVSPTNITISWETNDIESSGYDTVFLCDNAGSPLTDMLVNDTYEFICPANTLQSFKIICSSNQDPVANDDYAVVFEDSTDNQIDVLDNDYDDDGDDLEIIDVTTPSHGSAYTDGDYVYYTPDPEYNGADAFDYTISDGNEGSDTATVYVTVTGVNDDPVANDDYAVVFEDSTDNQIDVLDNDYDPDFDDLEIISVTNPPHGSAYTDGDYVYYTPDPEYNGADDFDYTISDGNEGSDTATVYVTVTGVNDDPIANNDYAVVQEYSTNNQIDVLDNDYDPDGDDLEIIDVTTPSHGTATYDEDYVYYTPEAGYSGADEFDYTITDNNGSSGVTARVYIIITENKPPETPNAPSGSTFGYFNTPYEYTASTTDPDIDQIYYMFYWGDGTYSDWLGPYDSGDPAAASHTWTVGGNYGVKVKAKDVHNAESSWSDSITVHIAAPELEIRQINGGISKVSAKIKNNGDAPTSQINWRVSIKGGILGLIDVTISGTISSLDINEEAIIDTDDASIVGFGLVDITVTAETTGAPVASDTVKGFVLLYIVFVIS